MQEILKALSWTFLHSLWQGLLAAVLVAIIITATKKASARLRYNLLGTVLILFLVTTLFTFQAQLQSPAQPLADEIANGIGVTVNSNSFSPAAGITGDLATWFNDNTGLLMLAWSVLFLLNCLKLFTGLATVHRLRSYKTFPAPKEWMMKLSELQKRLGLGQPVKLLQSGLVKVPVALGILRPIILVPAGLLASIPPEQAETILLHELSHIRRKDYLVNLIQRFADAVFFFNPAFCWISSLLRQEREACCDDMVVANAGGKREYLEALVSFQEYSMNLAAPVMAIGSKRHYLLNRVKRILTNENKRLNLLERACLLAGLVFLGAFTVINEKNNSTPAENNEVKRTLEYAAPSWELPVLPALQPLAPVKKERKRINPIDKPVIDTMPTKKDSQVVEQKDWQMHNNEKQWQDAALKSKQTLNEIVLLKEKMGKKKEEIGVIKEKLKALENGNKLDIEKEKLILESKRRALERDRSELEIKRSDLDRFQQEEKKKNQAKKDNAGWESNESKDWNRNGKGEEWETKKETQKENSKEKLKEAEAENKHKNDGSRIIKPRVFTTRVPFVQKKYDQIRLSREITKPVDKAEVKKKQITYEPKKNLVAPVQVELKKVPPPLAPGEKDPKVSSIRAAKTIKAPPADKQQ